MKTIIAYIAGFVTALAFAAGAATVTITTTGAEDARISAAFGDYLGLGRNATGPEVKAAMAAFVVSVVAGFEFRQADATARAGVAPIAPQ